MNNGMKYTGILVTVVYGAGVACYAWINWTAFKGLEPNAVGDFLAGAFSPLAFLWLVLGFFQQGYELRQNNEALRLQAEELRNSVDQQRELVGVTEAQLNAQLEVIQVEREARIKELSPRIRPILFAHGRDSRGTFYRVSIQNLGFTALDVEAFVDVSGTPFRIGTSNLFRREEFIQGDVSVADGSDVVVRIVYKDYNEQPYFDSYSVDIESSPERPRVSELTNI